MYIYIYVYIFLLLGKEKMNISKSGSGLHAVSKRLSLGSDQRDASLEEDKTMKNIGDKTKIQ